MTPYQKVIDALAAYVQVRDQGSSARAQCPVHGSRGLTLAVRPGTTDDGRDKATVTCFAGCETTDVLTAIGLELRDLYEPATGPREYVPLRRPTFDLGKAGKVDLEELGDRLARRSTQAELVETLGPDLLNISNQTALADFYVWGRHD